MKNLNTRPNGMKEISDGSMTVIFKLEDDGGMYVQGYKEGVPTSEEESLKIYKLLTNEN